MLFSMWVTFAAGYQAVYQTMLLLLVGIPLYGFLKARRERTGQVAPPVELTEVTAAAGPAVIDLASADGAS